MVEIRVIGEDAEVIKQEIAALAEGFGLATGAVSFERASDHTVIGTAIGTRG